MVQYPAREPKYHALVLDPSLTATGYAIVQVPFDDNPDGTVENPVCYGKAGDGGVLHMGQVTLKDTSLALNDRIDLLLGEMEFVVATARRNGHEIAFVAAEVPPHLGQGGTQAKNMNAVISQQRAFGALAALFSHHLELPYLEVSPDDTKFCLAGNRRADKKTMQWMLTVKLTGTTPQAKKLPREYTEAVVDALSVAFWCDAQFKLRRYASPSGLDGVLARVPHRRVSSS